MNTENSQNEDEADFDGTEGLSELELYDRHKDENGLDSDEREHLKLIKQVVIDIGKSNSEPFFTKTSRNGNSYFCHTYLGDRVLYCLYYMVLKNPSYPPHLLTRQDQRFIGYAVKSKLAEIVNRLYPNNKHYLTEHMALLSEFIEAVRVEFKNG